LDLGFGPSKESQGECCVPAPLKVQRRFPLLNLDCPGQYFGYGLTCVFLVSIGKWVFNASGFWLVMVLVICLMVNICLFCWMKWKFFLEFAAELLLHEPM
jgi:hypothetical protein